jgi:hypothetical protein
MNKTLQSMRLRATRAGFALALAVLVAACGGGGGGGTPAPATPEFPGLPPVIPETPTPDVPATFKMNLVSSPADRVTGNEALVDIELLEIKPGERLQVISNGVDYGVAFSIDDRNGHLVGKVGGLTPGANQVEVKYAGYVERLPLTVYPKAGPVFSGPQSQPFVCATNFNRTGGTQMVLENDGKCSAKTLVSYFWVSTTGARSGYTPGTAYAANMDYFTINGKTVPYLVRLESGTVNRGWYQSAVLHDYLNEPTPSPVYRSNGWNGKLIYTTSGGCRGGWFHQGDGFDTLFDKEIQQRGYAVVSSSLNHSNTNCNDVVAAETALMVKEQFTKSYGVPYYTVGLNTLGNGGGFQANEIAENYPGLFDGVITSQSMPDLASSALLKAHDARLLNLYFTQSTIAPTTTAVFSNAQKLAVTGFTSIANVTATSAEAIRMDPVGEFPAVLPFTPRYDPVSNRTGARSTAYDAQVNVYGKTAEGHALRPIDNVGVQYGLRALNAGTITVDQFLDLNDRIGGMSRDFTRTAARTVADAAAVERAYKSGRIVNGGGGLASTAIIDRRDWTDTALAGSFYTKIHSYSLRERLVKANGHADNHVILSSVATGSVTASLTIDQMDEWLMAALGDSTAGRTKAQKIAANRPASLQDACWIAGVKTTEPQTAAGGGTCNTAYPAGTTPRMVAGGPLSDDVVKCQLKPVVQSDYTPGFNVVQWARLQLIFPQGVCDWTRPGVGQQALAGTWQSFGPAPANLLFDITKP